MEKPKVFVVGLDGATWDVILPLVEKNELPMFKKLIEHGAWGVLKSTIPPVTIPAWPAFVTGKNPGKFGVFDFFVLDDKNKPRIVTSKDITSKKIWNYLDCFGFKSIILNLPNSYPPEKLRGVMISGMLTPEGKSFAYPPEVEKIASEIGYVIEINVTAKRKYRGKQRLIEELLKIIDKRFELADVLIEKYGCDFFFILIRETDIIQHFEYKNLEKVARIYKHVDGKLTEFLKKHFTGETLFILMSDHGFSPLKRYVYINNFLHNKGLLKTRKLNSCNTKSSSWMYRALFRAGITKGKLAKIFKKLKVDSLMLKLLPLSALNEVPTSLYEVDILKSVAFFGGKLTIESTYILINKEKVNDEKEYEALRESIMRDLKNLLDPETGKPVILEVFKGEDLFRGGFSKDAPDIVVLLNKGYSMNASITEDGKIIESVPTPSGTHDIDGMVIFYGKKIKPQKIQNATIYDLMPTILHIFGLPIPDDVDGRVLKEVFDPNSEFAKGEVRVVNPSYYDDLDEKSKIKAKIRKLKIKDKI